MRKLPPLSALRVFEAAARRLSFRLAAEELHVTPTAVSHQIRQLEDWMGVRLFERGTRKVSLTGAGARLFPPLRDGLDSFERAVDEVRRSQAAKVATLSSTVAFMARRLAPLAGSFRSAYPDWTLRLDASNDPVDLDGEADAAIRYGRGHYPGLVVVPLLADRFAPVCTPRLAAAARKGLRGATLIHFEWGPIARADEQAPTWRRWLEAAGMTGVDAEAGLSFTDEIHAVHATLAGQGIGMLSLNLVADEIASGLLVQPFDVAIGNYRYDLVYSPRAAARPATVVLVDWVRRAFGPVRETG
ncbi:MAG TPA: LysR substrate-binding domain-containing protein [Noviherbaspirillum sp.]|nr:LysR substrate-binding domain-containing protein [Noviherbaspirillum sp.]